MMKLRAEGLCYDYEGKRVLSDVSFAVGEREFVSVLGPSGCGKSTLLNVLAGVIAPAGGHVYVDGGVIRGVSHHFAYMPQNDLLFPWKTIMENVCLYGRIHGGARAAREEAARSFAQFGLAGYENAYPRMLSGGMRQRAAFLRTALCGADILLLDEPFGALDVISRGDMQDWLLAMRGRLSRTALLVTHDIDEAIYLSDRILVLRGAPARIACEVTVPKAERTRSWLYAQGALRMAVYDMIKGEGT